MTRFTTGRKRLRDKFNRDRDDLDSVLGMNLRGDGIIEVKHIGQGQTLNLSINQLLRRIAHVKVGGGGNRLAFSKDAAAANTDSFTCFLDVDGTGDEIDVAPVVNTTVIAMSLAAPRLYDGTPLTVWKDSGGTWRTAVTFEKAGPC